MICFIACVETLTSSSFFPLLFSELSCLMEFSALNTCSLFHLSTAPSQLKFLLSLPRAGAVVFYNPLYAAAKGNFQKAGMVNTHSSAYGINLQILYAWKPLHAGPLS